METKGYNGWTNYETWCCSLWIDNDEACHNAWNEAARLAWHQAEAGYLYKSQTRAEHATSILADRLKACFEEGSYRFGISGFYADLMNAALGEVNWHEIARDRIDDLEKEEEAEETEGAEA
jgi:uncharacterized membrane protein YgcG